MCKYEIKQIIIGQKFIDELTDEDGIKWYPLGYFLEKILCKSDKVSSFRDSNVSKYMKIIEYSCDRPRMRTPKKIWCINEKGIKYLLKNMLVVHRGKKSTFKSREKGYAEACLYFNIKNKKAKIDPLFITGMPKSKLDFYDIWSVICIKNDPKIEAFTKWKKCPECEYYYPYLDTFFGKAFNNDSKCLQCKGSNFKCKNKIIQFIYDNDGLELLYCLFNNEDNNEINKDKLLEEVFKLIERG